MAEIELTRVASLNKGFTCPTKGCGRTVTHRDIAEAHGVTMDQYVPAGYSAVCPKCGTRHRLNITDPEALVALSGLRGSELIIQYRSRSGGCAMGAKISPCIQRDTIGQQWGTSVEVLSIGV